MSIGLTEASLNFRILRDIGQEGKNSDVFIAHDKQFDAEIVIKKISKINIPIDSGYFQEAKCLYKSRHQNVVSVNYSCQDESSIYIAMPLYKNGSLEKLMETKFLTVREIIKYSIDFLTGLYHIHSKGLIHFDIKPNNILLSDSNSALLTDFGLAKFQNNDLFACPDQMYSYHIPPERFTTDNLTILSDIYQSGVTIYRLCNGTNWLTSQLESKDQNELTSMIKQGIFPDRDHYLAHIPKKLKKLVNKALHVNPDKRFDSVIKLLNSLSCIEENLDWRYFNQNAEYWELDLDAKTYKVECIKNDNQSTFNIITTKYMKSSKKTTRERKFCINNIDSKKLDSILTGVISNLDKTL